MTNPSLQAEYNQRFLDRVAVRSPGWLHLVEKATYEGVEYIKIEFPPPDGQDDSIVITTYGDVKSWKGTYARTIEGEGDIADFRREGNP